MTYRSGDYYIICARCGCKLLRSQALIDVSQGQDSNRPNILVCSDHFEGIHPQERKQPRIRDPRTLPAQLIRTDDTTFRPSGIWERISLNWEDITDEWEDLDGGNTYDEIADTLVGKD